MLLIWGHKHDFEFLGTVPTRCPGCGRSPCGFYKARGKFTLYGIPTFTTRSKYALGCQPCDKHWELDQEEGERLLRTLEPPAGEGAAEPRAAAAETQGAPIIVQCLHCGQKNRVQAARRAQATCGRCRRPL